MTDGNLPPRIHVLAKPTGAICNLNCSYCFFLNKAQLYPGSDFRMSDEVLEHYLRQLIECHRTSRVTVAWQGGESTLMGLDFYRRALAFQDHAGAIQRLKSCKFWRRRMAGRPRRLPKLAAMVHALAAVAANSRNVMVRR